MSKDLETLAVAAALGVTAFIFWRAWRDGKLFNGKTPQSAMPSTVKSNLVPTADDFISSIYGAGTSVSAPSPAGDMATIWN